MTFVAVAAVCWGWGPDGRPVFAYSGWEWALPAGAVTTFALARRRAPWLVLAVAIVLEGMTRRADIAAEPFTTGIALFSLADLRGRRQALLALALTLAALGLSVPLADRTPAGLALCAVVALLAVWLGLRFRRDRDAVDRADRLERQVRAERERTRVAELERTAAEHRVRVGRSVHDTLTNTACLSARLADVATVAVRRDDHRAALDAVAQIGRVNRQGLAEIRALVRGLVDDDVAGEAGSVVASIDDVLSAARRAGLPIRASVQGAPASGELLGIAVRVLRECLANAIRHAEPDRVEVTVAFEDGARDDPGEGAGCHGGQCRVEVVNDGADPARARATGGGVGTASLRALAAEHGGTFASGPGADGAWHACFTATTEGGRRG